MKSVSSALKDRLWRAFGDKANPSEWDGATKGGGKLSQRYWEYFKTIALLDLTPDSVVLDLGGGSPDTGAGFFALTIAPFVKVVHIMDECISPDAPVIPNILYHRYLASHDVMKTFFEEHPEITHVTCISVFEHIDPATRIGMIQALNDHFRGDIFVATLEYHPTTSFFPSQLTARSLAEMVAPFTNFYLEEMENSPVLAEDANRPIYDFRWLRNYFDKSRWRAVPAWYPLAMKFMRTSAD